VARTRATPLKFSTVFPCEKACVCFHKPFQSTYLQLFEQDSGSDEQFNGNVQRG
jgi:hypothetical protein